MPTIALLNCLVQEVGADYYTFTHTEMQEACRKRSQAWCVCCDSVLTLQRRAYHASGYVTR